MEISKSSHSNTRMEVDGSSLNDLMDFTTDEKIEAKEWISNLEIIAAQQDGLLCQDDMFSLVELSVVEDQIEKVIVETTIYNGTTTQTMLSHESHESGALVEMNNCRTLVIPKVKLQVPSLQSQPREEVIKNGTVEQSTPVNTEIEDIGKSQKLENNHTAQIDARDVTQIKDVFDIGTGDKCRKEYVQLNQLILDNSQNVKGVSTTNLVSTTQEDQPHLSQPEIEQLKSYGEWKCPETTTMKGREEVSNLKQPGFKALK